MVGANEARWWWRVHWGSRISHPRAVVRLGSVAGVARRGRNIRPGLLTAGLGASLVIRLERMPIPATLRTARLLLRSWNAADAPALAPVLAANVAHLSRWIPAHVSTPVPPHELAERLAGFEADFAAGRAFRYALLTPDESRVFGEADLFPRSAAGRVALPAADRVELGYWLDAAVTGRGLATEAARALLGVAAALPGMIDAEIRCDQANEPSATIPRRLGFHLASVEDELQIWRKPLERAEPVASPPRR
jgi:RimJ/RimL family protein N-acetyltransferase